MSTETHTEAGGLAKALKGHSLDRMSQDSGQQCKCGSDSRFQQPNDPPWSSIHEHRAHIALSWLTARLTDDDVRQAARAEINDAYYDARNKGQTMETAADNAVVAALTAAVDVIGGESDD